MAGPIRPIKDPYELLAAGDIVLSLLFWGLANETTALQDAAVLYPLFGVGANVGQVGVAAAGFQHSNR